MDLSNTNQLATIEFATFGISSQTKKGFYLIESSEYFHNNTSDISKIERCVQIPRGIEISDTSTILRFNKVYSYNMNSYQFFIFDYRYGGVTQDGRPSYYGSSISFSQNKIPSIPSVIKILDFLCIRSNKILNSDSDISLESTIEIKEKLNRKLVYEESFRVVKRYYGKKWIIFKNIKKTREFFFRYSFASQFEELWFTDNDLDLLYVKDNYVKDNHEFDFITVDLRNEDAFNFYKDDKDDTDNNLAQKAPNNLDITDILDNISYSENDKEKGLIQKFISLFSSQSSQSDDRNFVLDMIKRQIYHINEFNNNISKAMKSLQSSNCWTDTTWAALYAIWRNAEDADIKGNIPRATIYDLRYYIEKAAYFDAAYHMWIENVVKTTNINRPQFKSIDDFYGIVFGTIISFAKTKQPPS